MKETIMNMTLAEDGIAILGVIIGFVIGWVVCAIRRWTKDAGFNAEEKRIERIMEKSDLDALGDMAEEGRLSFQPSVRNVLRRIHGELDEMESECEIESDSELVTDLKFKLERILKI